MSIYANTQASKNSSFTRVTTRKNKNERKKQLHRTHPLASGGVMGDTGGVVGIRSESLSPHRSM